MTANRPPVSRPACRTARPRVVSFNDNFSREGSSASVRTECEELDRFGGFSLFVAQDAQRQHGSRMKAKHLKDFIEDDPLLTEYSSCIDSPGVPEVLSDVRTAPCGLDRDGSPSAESGKRFGFVKSPALRLYFSHDTSFLDVFSWDRSLDF